MIELFEAVALFSEFNISYSLIVFRKEKQTTL